MNKKTYRIADIMFSLENEQEILETPGFKEFVSDGEAQMNYKFRKTDSIKTVGESVYIDDFTDVRKFEGEYFRIFLTGRIKTPYCISNDAICYFLEKKSNCFEYSKNLFFHAGIERMLIKFNRIIFHSSLIATDFGGILFSGKSGQGKSTQAELWNKNESAEIICGDKSVITFENGSAKAYGFPYDGSARVCKNKSANISAIVFPEHSTENALCRLSKKDAYLRIYSQLIISSYDKNFSEIADKVIMQIIDAVPVYLLSCTADKRAVETLKKELEEKNETH